MRRGAWQSRALVAVLLTLGILVAGVPPSRGVPAPARLDGGDPVATSVRVSQAGWDAADRVVIVSANGWSDGLAAAGLDAPVLYVWPDSLPGGVADEIRRLGAGEAVVVGGVAAVHGEVREALRDMGLGLTEVAGEDRFETADAVSGLLPDADEVLLVSGETWADAAAAAPLAAARHLPVFLTTRQGLPFVPDRLAGASHVWVVGGEAAVPGWTLDDLPPVDRFAGDDRYATSAAVADALGFVGVTGGDVVLAPGYAPVEAMLGGELAGRRHSAMLLAGPGRLAESGQRYLTRVAQSVGGLTIVGRPDQVGQAAVEDAQEAIASADLLSWVNDARAGAGLSSLGREGGQTQNALNQATAMMRQARLFHAAPSCTTWGEAVGSGDVRAVFDAWMRSPAHRAVIFFGPARLAGTAVLTGSDGRRWVVLDVCG